MRYRTFPKLPDLPISVLGFGCMRLPIVRHPGAAADPPKIDERLATQLIEQAVEAGVNYFDTAWPYHDGESEVLLGRALRGGLRTRVLLADKLPVWLVKTESDWDRLLEEQRKRLQTDTIDFYLLHSLNGERWEMVRQLRGLEALERARTEGRIRHIGFSFHGSLDEFKTIADGYDWTFCQVQYNFLDEHYQAGTEGVRHAAARRIGVIAMEPLRGGGLTLKVPDAVQTIWSRHPVARTPADWALRWVLNDADIVTALSGMNSESQLRENLQLADAVDARAMTPGELALVDEVRRYYHARMKVACTTCGYCQPCPNGVAIPDVLSTYNSSGMFDAKKSAAFVYRAFILGAGHGADACLDCGECEPKCPQAIPIAEKLKEAHAHLVS